jgi:hypothetical protein
VKAKATPQQLKARYTALIASGMRTAAACEQVRVEFGYRNVRSVYLKLAAAKADHIADTDKMVSTPFPAFTVLPKAERATTDAERWKDTLSTLRTRDGYIRVMHLCDLHFPDHYEPALNLAYRLVARTQPQVIVVGSDTADFGLISSFTPNADADEDISDELDEIRRYWIPHIDTLKSLAPNAALVFAMGNHEQRIYDHMTEHAPKLRRTIERAWIDLVSYQGRVMWLGRTEEVEVGHLLVKHGDKTNEHVAKALLESESYQVSVMAGHVHRLSTYYRMGRRYPVSAVTSGCLCKLDAHYLKRPPSRRWQHGTCVATVDLKGTDVWFQNVEFRQRAGDLVAVSDGELLAQAA